MTVFSVYFLSNAYNVLNPANQTSDFKVGLPFGIFSFLKSDHILCAIKEVTFTLRKSETLRTVGILSNLCENQSNIFVNSTSRNILYSFDIKKTEVDNSGRRKSIFTARNLRFQKTEKFLLHKASFKLCNLLQSRTEDFADDIDFNFPCIIEVLIQDQPSISKLPTKSMEDYHFYLSSNDQNSQKFFPDNKDSNFEFKLAARMNLLEGNWYMKLRDFRITNKLFNVPDNSFWVKYIEYIYSVKIDPLGNEIYVETPQTRKVNVKSLKPGLYPTSASFIDNVNALLIDMKLKCFQDKQSKFVCFRKKFDQSSSVTKFIQVKLSYNLGVALGYIPISTLSKSEYVIDVYKMKVNSLIVATKSINIFFKRPSEFLLCCNILKPSIIGSRMSPILKMIHVKDHDQNILSNEVLQYSWLVDNNFDKKIEVNSFETIRFYIEDIYGNTIVTRNDLPSILHISIYKNY